MMQPGGKQKFVIAVARHLKAAVQIDQVIDLAFHLFRRAVLVNLPIRLGWTIGLLLETALIQFGFEYATELINSAVDRLVSSQ